MLAALSAVQTNLFDYNVRSELIEAAMGTNDYQYEYDPIGNRMRAVRSQNSEVSTNLYTANELNQYLSVTSALSVVNYSYDADGNLTNANGWTFTWDAENRLLIASNGNTVVHNTYDYMSRRIRKETLEGETPASRTFIYDGWNLLSEVSSQNSEVSTDYYMWGLDLSGTIQGAGGVGGLLFMLNADSCLLTPSYDANENITDYVDTNGILVAHYQYDPYGNITHAEGAKSAEMTFRFPTKCLDSDPDLYYYGYRFYSPELGRWINRDPIGDEAFAVSHNPNILTSGKVIHDIRGIFSMMDRWSITYERAIFIYRILHDSGDHSWQLLGVNEYGFLSNRINATDYLGLVDYEKAMSVLIDFGILASKSTTLGMVKMAMDIFGGCQGLGVALEHYKKEYTECMTNDPCDKSGECQEMEDFNNQLANIFNSNCL